MRRLSTPKAGVCSVAILPIISSAGFSLIALSSAQSYTLTPSASQVNPGASLSISWTAPSGRPPTDWIALYKVGDPNTAYGWWQYTQGATSGTFNLTAPSQAGLYEFRYLLQNGFNVAATSSTVIVTAFPTVSLTAPANNAQFTAPATITFEATASDSDGSVARVDFAGGAVRLSGPPLHGGWPRHSASLHTRGHGKAGCGVRRTSHPFSRG